MLGFLEQIRNGLRFCMAFSIVHISRKIDVYIYIYIYYIDQIISFIVPPSTSCAVREKIKYVLCLQYFSLKSTKKHAPFAWPLVCRHSKCKPRKRLKALSSLVIKMLCWSYGIKLLKARPKALFSNYFWPKSYVACTFSLSVRGARFKLNGHHQPSAEGC